MKTKNLFTTMVLIGTIVLLGSCSKGSTSQIDPVQTGISADLKSGDLEGSTLLTGTIADVPIATCVIAGTANADETAGLLFMREEEKLAYDVYVYLFAKYKLPVFLNISKSESVHVAAVLRLMAGFNIPDNSSNTPGVYVNTHIADLYKQLIEMGNLSVNDALKVGAIIEQTDINDLQAQLLLAQNTSIKTVYSNLLAGSNAHLKAFLWNLKVRGVVYP